MNIHPIFVHFPIALFVLYALIECIRLRKFLAWDPAFYIKLVLVVASAAFALITLPTGEAAQELIPEGRTNQLIELHSQWAKLSTALFIILAGGYFITWLRRDFSPFLLQYTEHSRLFGGVSGVAFMLARIIMHPFALIPLMLAGFAAITITGALGAAIVYGPTADPIVSVIYDFFLK